MSAIIGQCKPKIWGNKFPYNVRCALAGVAQWSEHQPAGWEAACSIPCQGTGLGCGPGPQLRVFERQPIYVSKINTILKKMRCLFT